MPVSIIENIAVNIAAELYEVGRSQGMTSVHKDARAYARANLEKFIPKAVELAIDMLSENHISEEMKAQIYEALLERVHDPDLVILNQTPKPQEFTWKDGKNPFAKG